jgi:hypothetical protein
MPKRKKFDPFVVGEEREFGISVCVAMFLYQDEMKTTIYRMPSQIDQCDISKASYSAGHYVLFSC